LWQTFLHKIVKRRAENITSYRHFTNISIPYFDKNLQKRKICIRWAPHCLTAEQKQKCLEIAALLKQRFNVESQALLERNVAIDNTWVRDIEPELKSQPNEWKSLTSPRLKIFRRTQSKVKQLMIFFYDHLGIIMTDRVPCGTSVTTTYYRDWMQTFLSKVHKTDLNCSRRGPLILHDEARPHLEKVVTNLLNKYE
jgi:uncharacterized protein YeaC (DUF1315 family)